MIDTADVLQTFDEFAQHVDGVLQSAAGSSVVAFSLEHGRFASWKRGRFRIRLWPTQAGVVVMVELDRAFRDDFLESRSPEAAQALGEQFAAVLAG